MATTQSIIELNIFCSEKNIDILEFISFVGHKEHNLVYGSLFSTDKGMLIQLQKHIEINQNKLPPKICSMEQCKHKLVGDEIWDSFKKITLQEHSDRWGDDLASLKQ